MLAAPLLHGTSNHREIFFIKWETGSLRGNRVSPTPPSPGSSALRQNRRTSASRTTRPGEGEVIRCHANGHNAASAALEIARTGSGNGILTWRLEDTAVWLRSPGGAPKVYLTQVLHVKTVGPSYEGPLANHAYRKDTLRE